MCFSQESIAIEINITVEPDEDGFHAYCPTLKGLHVSGTTREEAIGNAKEAIVAYLYSMMKHGDPVPEEARRAPRRKPVNPYDLNAIAEADYPSRRSR